MRNYVAPRNARRPDRRSDACLTADERLEILNDREGAWRCRTIFNCTEACPREIRITKAIGEVKKAIPKGSARAEPIRHPATSAA
jgi:succinate dehydrogenase/fumarate reductase-like Fe-S protein